MKLVNLCSVCKENWNEFALVISKEVHPYKCMDSSVKLDKGSLTSIESLYSKLKFEYISKLDYKHAKMCEVKKNLGDFVYLYVPSDALFLADIFDIFIDICWHTDHSNPTGFVKAQG